MTSRKINFRNLCAAIRCEAAFQTAVSNGFIRERADTIPAYRSAKEFFNLGGFLAWNVGMLESKARADIYRHRMAGR